MHAYTTGTLCSKQTPQGTQHKACGSYHSTANWPPQHHSCPNRRDKAQHKACESYHSTANWPPPTPLIPPQHTHTHTLCRSASELILKNEAAQGKLLCRALYDSEKKSHRPARQQIVEAMHKTSQQSEDKEQSQRPGSATDGAMHKTSERRK
jgi:hypothetical protein